jgi:MFS superfamily sulfate permease-like transporter
MFWFGVLIGICLGCFILAVLSARGQSEMETELFVRQSLISSLYKEIEVYQQRITEYSRKEIKMAKKKAKKKPAKKGM